MARVSIEDCQKVMPNRFALVIVAANRTRQLMSNSVPLVYTKNKQAVTALREIAEGKVTVKGEMRSPFETLAEGEAALLANAASIEAPVLTNGHSHAKAPAFTAATDEE